MQADARQKDLEKNTPATRHSNEVANLVEQAHLYKLLGNYSERDAAISYYQKGLSMARQAQKLNPDFCQILRKFSHSTETGSFRLIDYLESRILLLQKP